MDKGELANMTLRVGDHKGFAIVLNSLLNFMYKETAERLERGKEVFLTALVEEVQSDSGPE